MSDKDIFEYNGKALADDVKHSLEIILTDDLCAFFAIAYTCRALGDDRVDLVPTMYEMSGRLTIQERLRVAEAISNLAKSIRRSALSSENRKEDDDG